jgi:uncharacterized membrane protein YhaH (DUF805 family)
MEGFGGALKSVLSNYTNYDGRASRSEYFYWYLLLAAPVAFIETMVHYPPDKPLYYGALGLFVSFPTLALGARRLHDIGRTGWWQLLLLIPFGFLILFALACKASQPGSNAYGDEPTYYVGSHPANDLKRDRSKNESGSNKDMK